MIRLVWGFSLIFFLFSTLKRFIKFNARKKVIKSNNQLIDLLGNKLCNSASERALLEGLKNNYKFKLFSNGWIIYFTILFFITLFALIYPALVYTKIWGFSETFKALFN